MISRKHLQLYMLNLNQNIGFHFSKMDLKNEAKIIHQILIERSRSIITDLKNKRQLYTLRSKSNDLDPQFNAVIVDIIFLMKPKKQ